MNNIKYKIIEYKNFCKRVDQLLSSSLNKESELYIPLRKKKAIELYEFVFQNCDSLLASLTNLYVNEECETEASVLRKMELDNLMKTFQRSFFLILYSYIRTSKNGKIIKINEDILYSNLNFIKSSFLAIISNIENLYSIQK